MNQIAPAIRSRAVLAPAGTRLYAVGDIHGRMDLLDRLLALILADAGRSRAARRVLVFLGDYVDRGPHSRAVMDCLMAGPPPVPRWSGFRWIRLRGNHEHAMLRFLEDGNGGSMWLANGGLATVRDYVGAGERDMAPDLPGMRAALRQAVPAAHLDFLRSLPLAHAEGDYFFAHAGLRPGVPLDRQDPADLMWIREEFLSSTADHGKLVVHGHTISPTPDIRRNRVGIDTGAYQSGQLTALVAEGSRMSFIST